MTLGAFPRRTESQTRTRTRVRLIVPLIVGISCTRPAVAPPTESNEPAPEPSETADTPQGLHRPEPRLAPRPGVQRGYATWYGRELAGHRTADGELFDPRGMTAAHRTLPFGTWVEVICLDTGRRVRVRITDRGPFGHKDRIIDLSRAAADQLGIRSRGTALVSVRVVSGP